MPFQGQADQLIDDEKIYYKRPGYARPGRFFVGPVIKECTMSSAAWAFVCYAYFWKQSCLLSRQLHAGGELKKNMEDGALYGDISFCHGT